MPRRSRFFEGYNLGAEIFKARRAANMSQRALAKALGTTQGTVSRWEAGAVPNGGDLDNLRRVLKVELSEQHYTDMPPIGPDDSIPVPRRIYEEVLKSLGKLPANDVYDIITKLRKCDGWWDEDDGLE